MNRHGYAVRKRGIVEQRDKVKETDLDEVRRQRYRSRFKTRSGGCPCEVLREAVQGYDEKLEKSDERPETWVCGRQLLERHRIAAHSYEFSNEARMSWNLPTAASKHKGQGHRPVQHESVGRVIVDDGKKQN